MNKPYFSLQTPCGDIIIEDDREIVFRLGLKEMVLTAAMTL